MKPLKTFHDLDVFSRENGVSLRYKYHASVGFLLTIHTSTGQAWGGMGETLEQALTRALISFAKDSNIEKVPESSFKTEGPKWEVCRENKVKPGHTWVCVCGYSSFDRPHFRIA